ncbi:MurR/RpiR family transcriptional regulator [Enterococcus sp. LJL128]|uniref:MurR/RpiR family transcriptional regulator n=1 Tax=Enterococcus sp. LJL51 TaxID=3416656 RepID=UPI003CFA7478
MKQNIILSIKDYRAQLPKSEQKIADYILDNTNEVITLSAQELAKKAASSPAAIIRFCHSINVNGFTELKLLLSANLGSMATDMYTEVEKDESVEAIKQKLNVRFVHAVERTADLLDERNITEVFELIEQAELIFVYGLGASSLVAQDIHQKFTRLGKNVFCTLDHHLFASAMGTTKGKSLFIAVSNSGETRELISLLSIAAENGIPTIGITQNEQSTVAKYSDIVLLTAKGEEAPLRSAATVSLIAQMYVVDVLFFLYASSNYDETLEHIQQSRKTVGQLKQ